MKKNDKNDEYTKELFAYYISLVGSRNTNLMDGEWLELKIFYIANVCRKMKLDCLATVIKEALSQYSNIPIFPAVQKQLFEEGEVSFEKKMMSNRRRANLLKSSANCRTRKTSTKLNKKTLKQIEKWKGTSFARFLVVKKVFAVTAWLMHVSISIWVSCEDPSHVSLWLTISIPAETTNVMHAHWHVRGMHQPGNINQEKHPKRKWNWNFLKKILLWLMTETKVFQVCCECAVYKSITWIITFAICLF